MIDDGYRYEPSPFPNTRSGFANPVIALAKAGSVAADLNQPYQGGYDNTGSPSGGSGRGRGTTLEPFELVDVSDGGGRKVRVVNSTLYGELPDGMNEGDDPNFVLTGISGSGYVYAKLTFTDTTGEATNREIVTQSSEPSEEDGVLWVQIGNWGVDGDGILHLSNSRYGPIDALICRDWYSSPPKYIASVV